METEDDHLRKGVNVSVYKSLIAGSIAGLVSRTATAPIDMLKLRLQVIPHKTTIFSGLLTGIVRDTIKKEGFRGFWKGNVPGSALYIIYGGVEFSMYSWYNQRLNLLDLKPALHSTIVGGLTGITASIVSYPFDVLRTRFAVNHNRQFSHLKKEILSVLKNEGIIGLYRGCISSIFTISLSTSILFGCFEGIKIFCSTRLNTDKDKHGEDSRVKMSNSESTDGLTISNPSDINNNSFLYLKLLDNSAGAISGFLSKLITFPLDTVRRRIQLKDSPTLNNYFDQDIKMYLKYRGMNFYSIGKYIVKQEGPMSLYRGVTLSLCKSVPGTALSIWTYEKCMRIGRKIAQ
ncbi:hypothetical protein TBLA_0C02280 [Henningerozyma blattae CBS 6284]|uniref:Mitochondrial thiamine pyrophosphate carrier 1 n=1 Tax=Henningerozyma blattae (strain ATCC 34711 / CBS 6284 / DSM 70876 / NBRC 10599 / NRRL Y-10934 / UCD 77-7) TaxID=1071380 RepID=I2H0Y7_HENB6|nr:hypothetical protein TBLA_0C02280 [Tetrapisispora blattae CBS 6284]CCH60039.1 hypothetical protein TBLA_0C02280 [Tetrapisispora blattae CBS 6284]